MIPNVYRADTAFHPPVSRPRASGLLGVGDGHAVWWEEIGPPDGLATLVVHGGPGGEIKPYYRRLLDPARHRGLFFDQRGCGRSTPFGAVEHNTTQKLIGDIEALRRDRDVERWLIVGGSWGSTLSLAYAQAHPERVAGLVLSGVYLSRREDLDWWWNGARVIFPEVYAARDSFLTPAERIDPRRAFHARLFDPDPAVHGPAALVLGAAELQTLDLLPPPPPDDPDTLDPKNIASARIFIHYDKHDNFLREGQLLHDAHRLGATPGAIVAGRSDICTPPKGAYDLAQAWPGASLRLVAAAGHRWSDERLGGVLVEELRRLTDLLTT